MLEGFRQETARWFEEALGRPTAVQEEAWRAIFRDEDVLISAPTGSGKTLAAFLVLLDRLKREAEEGRARDGVQAVYLSPLKSLASDIRENLERPLSGVGGPEITVGLRTGDTPDCDRRKMLKTPPQILVTTPESLYILLCTQRGRSMLRTARWVVADELHALISTKRGAHMALSLSRLDALCERPPVRIGLSATVEPLSLAAEFLSPQRPARIVAPKMEKRASIAVCGLEDEAPAREGTLWPRLAQRIVSLCENARTAIAFVEGRAQAERLAGEVNKLAGQGFALTHHGSVSKEQRQQAEAALRSGTLRLLCATSSMELGIDVGEVDLVVQVGCPVTVSSALQRMGRSGHDPHRVSVMRIFPKTPSDALWCGLTAACARDGHIESAHPIRGCLDVLSQHLVSMASEGAYTVDDALTIFRGAWPTRDVSREDICKLLEMLSGDWERRADVPASPRILYDRIHASVTGDDYTRMLALSSGGAIPDRGLFPCVTADGRRVGELDEEFVFEARVGDRFLLGAFAWRIEEIGKDRVVVAPASAGGAQAPFWRGEAAGRAYGVSLRFGRMLRNLAGGPLKEGLSALAMDEAAAKAAERHIKRQLEVTGCLPDDETIVAEHFTGEAGESQMMVHSLFGRRVNSALALLLQAAASRRMGTDVRSWDDDNGMMLYAPGPGEIPEGLLMSLDPARARDALRALLPGTPLFFMAFRYNAARALMMGVRGGKRQPLWAQRIKGARALETAVKDMEHPLIRETVRECLEDLMDLGAVEEVLSRVRSGRITVREIHTDAPSPMSLPMRRQAEAELMYDYAPIPGAAREAAREALMKAGEGIKPARAFLAPDQADPPRDREHLHSRLLNEGDMLSGEMAAPVEWALELAREGRCAYTEGGLWIAAEDADMYARADGGDGEARSKIIRRCLRFRGPQDGESLTGRYGWDADGCREALRRLTESGEAVEMDGAWYHRAVYERARKQTLIFRRSEIRTLPAERYAALMARSVRRAGRPEDQMREALEALRGRAFPLAAWEESILPARVDGYQPRMLDQAAGRGEWVWQIGGDGKTLAFHGAEEADWDKPPLALDGAELTEDEAAVARALSRRGASFASALAPLTKEPVGDILLSLARRGLARSDSFSPIRALLALSESAGLPPKRLARLRSSVLQSGRWELTRPRKEKGDEALLLEDFREARILCRETARRLPWRRALDTLRLWEYAGRARRGYFVDGLSGIQFILSEDYERVVSGLQDEEKEAVWLSAADPAQMWGGPLAHGAGEAFLCVSGTAVCLWAGRPCMVLEKGTSALRTLIPSVAGEALRALARAYKKGYLFPGRARVTIRQGAEGLEPELEAAGFYRDGMYYTIWRDL